ncbi:amidohydrolase [bacterium]|nr:MAG: amidohydrolase [bacterium]
MKKLNLFLVLCFWAVTSLQAQITEKPEYGKFAITNAKIYTVTNGIIEQGFILIDNGVITEVTAGVAKLPAGYKVINAQGKSVYPGFIDSGTLLGLREIEAVPVTNDQAEIGEFTPNMRAFTAINPASVNIPVTRVNGVTTVIAHPVNGTIAGKSTLINLFGYSPDSMAVVADAALQMEWPSSGKRGFWDQRDEKKIKEDFEKTLKNINDYWEKARFYNDMMSAYEANPKGKSKPDKNVEWDAMRPVFNGSLPVVIDVNRENDILEALKWIKEHKGIKFVLSSASEGWRVADKIAEAGVPCLVGPTLRTISRSYDNYQAPYQNAGKLHKAGVMVAIRTGETENTRNLNYNAGYAAAYGLGTEEALKAVTINPAKIFGADSKIGSLEKGKMANLMITNGDPFEPLTNIETVFINGYKIPMISRQTQLFEEYKDRDSTN